MKISSSIFFLAAACAVAWPQSAREFQGEGGLVRIAIIASGDASDSVAAAGDFETALKDSSAGPAADSLGAGTADALLDIYFLEKTTGRELRFPAKYSQIRTYFRQHKAGLRARLPEDRVVAMARDLSVSLCVRMKTPGTGGGK
jgi:hypothetical protein